MFLKQLYKKGAGSVIIKNSLWGVASNILQTLFVSLFFVIVANKNSSADFGRFLIATTMYQMIVAFSSLGLSQWFIRKFEGEENKERFVSRFIKMQVVLGIFFFGVSILSTYIIYPDAQIRLLGLILGVNIIFDNLIYGIKSLNIAEDRQRTTAGILVIDGFMKLCAALVLFVVPLSIVYLSLLYVGVRFVTVNLFIRIGTNKRIGLNAIIKTKITWSDIRELVLMNWRFVVIGSISIIYWRIANILISKFLTLKDVANYEIAFRLFSIFLILPTIISATVYARFVKHFDKEDWNGGKQLYHRVYLLYTIFAFLSFAFMQSFGDQIIAVAFGVGYEGAKGIIKEMFLTFLIFPTVLLQANLLVAMKLEKVDMQLNILSLAIQLAVCFAGLHYVRSVSVINYAILASFLCFHLLQEVVLIRKGMTTLRSCLLFYVTAAFFVYGYKYLIASSGNYIAFGAFSLFIIIISAISLVKFPAVKKLFLSPGLAANV